MPSFDVPTTLAQLAQAAADRGILLGPDPDHSILVAAHHAHWRIREDPKDLAGWCATRVDAAHRDIPPVTGWLGPRDLKPDRILDNLLAQRRLPTDMSGRQPWISTRHPWAAASDYHSSKTSFFETTLSVVQKPHLWHWMGSTRPASTSSTRSPLAANSNTRSQPSRCCDSSRFVRSAANNAPVQVRCVTLR